MKRITIVAVGLPLLLGLALTRGAAEPGMGGIQPRPWPAPYGGPPGSGACTSSGCSAGEPQSEAPTDRELRGWLERFAGEPMDASSLALETLLFHGPAARDYLSRAGTGALDSERAAFLERELARTRAWLEVRIVDEHGVERMRLDPVLVQLGEKQHLHADRTRSLQLPQISGTVKRVGLQHLWTRF